MRAQGTLQKTAGRRRGLGTILVGAQGDLASTRGGYTYSQAYLLYTYYYNHISGTSSNFTRLILVSGSRLSASSLSLLFLATILGITVSGSALTSTLCL